MRADRLYTIVVLFIICCIGLLLNGLVILISLLKNRVQGLYKWFLLNIAFWDFLFCLFSVTAQLHYLANENEHKIQACKVWGYIYYGVGVSTVTALPLVSINRAAELHPVGSENSAQPEVVAKARLRAA